jgi:hypothetical protein
MSGERDAKTHAGRFVQDTFERRALSGGAGKRSLTERIPVL